MMSDQMPTKKPYSQLRALWGITRSSLIATRRNISSLVFGLIFPLVFIIIFGYLGQGRQKINIALSDNIDKNNPIYQALSSTDSFKIKSDLSSRDIENQLKKGQLDGLINIQPTVCPALQKILCPKWSVKLTTTAAAPQQAAILETFINGIADKVNLSAAHADNLVIAVSQDQIAGRQYRTIDFILPGMLGFSLLNAGIFATAFVFLTLRQTLVIKRFFTTPVSRFSIVVGESVSRLLVSILQALVIIAAGYFFFHFTLLHGWTTVLEMLILATLGLIIFLGFGLIISSVSKDERTVAPLSQLITLPQFLLAGTFFPIDQLPKWLQSFANILPLTFLNDAMRKVAFEGATIISVWPDLLKLAVWGVIIYFVVVRVFRWEPSS